MARKIKDDWGNVIKDGDFVSFSYGIPPIGVVAEVKEMDGILWVLTPDHSPKQCRLSYLRKWFNFFKAEGENEDG